MARLDCHTYDPLKLREAYLELLDYFGYNIGRIGMALGIERVTVYSHLYKSGITAEDLDRLRRVHRDQPRQLSFRFD